MMTSISAKGLDFRALSDKIRSVPGDIAVTDCPGQRFIGAGQSGRRIEIHGVPGNALGAYLNGADIEVFGSAQDAVGDTMNAGDVIIHGNIGDTAGYAMRGGRIFVEGSAGYRAGIHMKSYRDRMPVLVIGGSAGSFLGEYQAGGIIIVLGLGGKAPIVSNFPCTGMHGGKLFLRSRCENVLFPQQVRAREATREDLREIEPHLGEFCARFGGSLEELLASPYTVVTPDTKNPYKQMYVQN